MRKGETRSFTQFFIDDIVFGEGVLKFVLHFHFFSSNTTARRSASARKSLISSSHFSSAIFSSSASFSSCNFFLKIEVLLDLDEPADSLHVNNTGLCSHCFSSSFVSKRPQIIQLLIHRSTVSLFACFGFKFRKTLHIRLKRTKICH